MLLQIFRKLRGKGTSTDRDQRKFQYLNKLAEIDYDIMDKEVFEIVKDVVEDYDLKTEILFHKEPIDRLPYDEDEINIA